MPYLGNAPSTSFATVVKDSFNGGSTAYTLSKVATTNSVSVFVENVRQEPTSAYSVSGTTLTFTATTPSGTGNIYVLHMNPTTTTTHPAAQALTATTGTFSSGISATTGTFTDNVSLADNDKLRLGASNDLDIYHDGSNSFIEETGTGDLRVKGSQVRILSDAINLTNAANSEDYITCVADGAVNLRYDGASCLTTASGGAITVNNGITLSDGNLTVASGHGIDFSATANLGSALATNNELLDDYEEGTWTPDISISSSDVVDATNATKDYRKIGDVVFISAHIPLNGAIPDGAFTITGLPTAVGGRGAMTITVQDESSSYVAFDNIPTALIDESGADIVCDTKGTAYASGDRINISGFYFTSSG